MTRDGGPRSATSHSGMRPARGWGLLGLAALCLLFAALAAVDLANVRPVSGDDALILAVSSHVAETGSLGSPLYQRVFGAGDHWFVNLPLQHLLQAAVFRIAGEGVAQARSVSLAAAIVLLCATTLLARRWFGTGIAAGTAVLLVAWRSGVIGLDYGLPLLAVARQARYDITAVALLWLALLTFDTHLRRPSRVWAFATGLIAAAAMLTQFHGALVLPALAALWWATRRDAPRPSGIGWVVFGLLLGLAPYVAYFAAHAADAVAQLRIVHGARMADGPAGLLRAVLMEPLRFSAAAQQRGIGQVGLLFAIVMVPWLVRRTAVHPRDAAGPRGIRALLSVSASMLIMLAAFESTKAPVYGLPLVPAFCMLLAAALNALWQHGRSRERPRSRAALAAALVLGTALMAEGLVALARDRIAARGVTEYAALAADIDAAMQPGEGVAGPAQWSWGLRTRPYQELRAIALRREALADTGSRVPGLEAGLRADRVGYVLLNGDIRADLDRGFYGERFGAELVRILAACSARVRVWNDATYGEIELRVLAPACIAG